MKKLFTQIDSTSLAIFRIAFGTVMAWGTSKYFTRGWIDHLFLQPAYHFSYPGFEWVQVLPGPWMYILFYTMLIATIFIACGVLYRLSMVVFFLSYTYVFLLDQAYYNNHYYLICLLGLLLIFVGADRKYSFRSWFAKKQGKTVHPLVPYWQLLMLQVQIMIVYVFGAIAKLNPDWLSGIPTKLWFAKAKTFQKFGEWFGTELSGLFVSYSGIVIDLVIAPLLFFKKTRVIAVIFVTAFHLFNSQLFGIGVFPWLMIAASVLFFEFKHSEQQETGAQKKIIPAVLAVYFLIQIIVPFRHYTYPGNASWTGRGDRFSWRMMLNDHDVQFTLRVKNVVTEEEIVVDPKDYMQKDFIRKLSPPLILQFAHFVADEFEKKGFEVEVYADATDAFNGRERQTLIYDDADLTKIEADTYPEGWIAYY